MDKQEVLRRGNAIGEMINNALSLCPDLSPQERETIVASVGVSLLAACALDKPENEREAWLKDMFNAIPEIANMSIENDR